MRTVVEVSVTQMVEIVGMTVLEGTVAEMAMAVSPVAGGQTVGPEALKKRQKST